MKNRIQDSGFRIQAGQAEASARPIYSNPKSQIPNPKHSAFGTRHSKGFTLIEMIVVIVISGIIAGMVAMFIRAPVQGYVDSSRRAEMSDIADTALRRLARDLRTAVPNSVRMPTPAGSTYIEFLPTRDGGRYRVENVGAGACGATGNELSFNAADTCFEVVGSAVYLVRGADDDHSDQIVIGSTQSDGGLPYDATAAGVRRPYRGVTGLQTAISIPAVKYPDSSELEGRRFEVVPADQRAVTYACLTLDGSACGTDANGDGTCRLMRYWNYGFNINQPAPPLGGSRAILADRVSFCNFVYDITNRRNSLVALRLEITRGNQNGGSESVNLYHEVHINNIP